MAQFDGMILPSITGDIVPLKIGSFKFPMECLVDVRANKKIVKTNVPGRNGTIKELTGIDDYAITVQAVFTAITRTQVETYLNLLLSLWQTEDHLSIVCPKTDLYGIDYVVLEGISHPETQGYPNVEKVTLNLLSDDIYDFGVE